MQHILSRHRPLLVEDGILYASRGLDLHASTDHGRSFAHVASCRLTWIRAWASRFRTLERIGRLGFHALQRRPEGDLVGVVRGQVVRRDPEGGDFEPVFEVPRGSRPLRLCLDDDGSMYFGEYFSNPDREAVRVYGSPDGRSWWEVHRFAPGSIRHIHGIVRDPYRDGLWVLTGDDDHECGLWFTGDGFRTVEAVLRGRQEARAVSVIPVENGLVVPTDSPRIRNGIQFLRLPESRLERLCDLPGSAFSAVRSGGLFLVATVAEPSPVNRSVEATVYASSDAFRWQRVAAFPPDSLSRALPFARRWLRYPELALVPSGRSAAHVFAYGRSVHGAEGRLVRWSHEGIREALRADPAGDR